ncbi:MAG: 2-dehydropantoate 2-reductase [Verrucomicrobiales bacterium]|nr:2-dehydropantoate 2-reductase [Verrucomicrobiales bacterium]
MKIAMVGCGAVGGYYGALLSRAGHETHFLLRSDYEAVLRNGMRVLTAAGDWEARPRIAREPGEIGHADLVVIALKTTANREFRRLLPPLVGAHSAVLTLQNGLGNEEALAALFPSSQILGGLCFVCLNREAPGVVRHIAHGRILLGEFGRVAGERTHTLARMFERSGVPCDVTDSLDGAHWEKLVWNIPFNGLGVASAAGWDSVTGRNPGPARAQQAPLTTDQLLADPRWHGLVREVMMEVITTARALGHPIPESRADHEIARTLEMGAYRASTLIDYAYGRSMELDSLFLEPARRAAGVGIRTPRLQAIGRVIGELAESGTGA